MVQLTLVPSQLAHSIISLSELAQQYRSDYRRVYIEHPRLRLDGVYISICYYVLDFEVFLLATLLNMMV